MIAKGAHSVRAQDRPAEATMNVAAAWELAKKVANIARAKKACAQAHARDILSLDDFSVEGRCPLRRDRRMIGSAMLVKKAVTAKRKLANVPKRIASAHKVLLSSEIMDSALEVRDAVWKPGPDEPDICLARTRPTSGYC